MENSRALVVDECAKDSRPRLDVSEAVSEIHRPLVRFGQRPLPELAQHVQEDALAAGIARIQRGEVLREALAEPLLVVVAPADRLAPPLVRDLVGEEELRKAGKGGRVVAPGRARAGQRAV